MSIERLLSALSALVLLSGCGTLKFLVQAGHGQLALMNRAKPIPEVIRDPRTPPRIARLLGEVEAIKKFSETRELRRTKNYVEYVALDRPAAVWVVSASEPLRFQSKEWVFPIVGGMPYLGWFDLESGKKFADELRTEGWDVDLRGAGAFSTLGWFRDPVLSSMIPQGEEALGDLINVVLHESVHATYYLGGQAYFNESLASFVGDRLTEEYLLSTHGAQSREWLAWQGAEEQQARRRNRMHEAYLELSRLYESSKSDAEKLAEKKKVLVRLMEELQAKRELNNATLIQYKAYNTGMKEFQAIYARCEKRWPCFWERIHRVTEKSFKKSQDDNLAAVLGPLGSE